MRTTRDFVSRIFSLCILVCASFSTHAESTHGYFKAKHTFIAGGYQQKGDLKVYSSKTQDPKDTIKLKDLGLDEKDFSWMAEYRYRLRDKWMFAFGAYKFDITGNKAIQKDFTFDGTEFEAGTSLKSKFDVDTLIADVLYSVYRSDRAEVLIGGGLHVMDINTSFESRTFIDDQERIGSRSSDTLTAPLPNLRLQAFYALSSKWGFATTLGWLSFNVDEYDGAFSYIHLRATYSISKRFGAALGYQFLDMDFSQKNSDGQAGLEAQFDGPSLHLIYHF